MKLLKQGFVIFCILAFGFVSYTACGGGDNNNNNANSNSTTDGGGSSEVVETKDGGGENNNNNTPDEDGPKEPGAPITVTFDPADGSEIGIQDCVKVTFSRAPSPSRSKRKASMMREGASSPLAVEFKLSDAGGEICSFSLLRYGTSYKLELEVTDPDDSAKTYPFSASFKTKAAPQGSAPDTNLAVNLKLQGVRAPVALQTLLGSVSADQIPPILLTLHSRDDGAKGKLLFVGGLGKGPDGGKPHEGKDVVDTSTPVSLALEGDFEGTTFYVGPTNFILSIAGFNLQLEDLRITGNFTPDGKSIKEAILEGVIDPELIKQQFGLDACATLLRDDCFKNAEGKDRVRIVGTLEGINNPLDFSAFITSPLYLQQGIDGAATKIDLYATEEIKKEDVTLSWSTCAGSGKEDKPCDKGEGATITPATVEGEVVVDDSKKKATFTPKAALTAGTWYQVEVTAKNGSGKEFKTSITFKTK